MQRALRRWRLWRFGKELVSSKAVVVGIVIAAGILALSILLKHEAGVAFADALRQIHKVRSVMYQQTGSGSATGSARFSPTMLVLVADRYRSRSDLSPSGVAVIRDMTPGNERTLTLNPQTHKAILVRAEGRKDAESNLLDWLLSLDAKQARPFGQKQVGGVTAEGFRVEMDSYDGIVWIDPQTCLPVEVELVPKPGVASPTYVAMTRFAWNVPVDESQVSMIPPAEYQQSEMDMDGSTPTERDLVAGLKKFAEFNDNRFPRDFTLRGTRDITMSLQAMKDTMMQTEATAMSDRLVQIRRAMMFAGNPANGEDWDYAGENVLLGQAGKPVVWYRPKGSATYRVINADLSVADVQPGEVPTVASVPMEPSPQLWAAPRLQPAVSPEPQGDHASGN